MAISSDRNVIFNVRRDVGAAQGGWERVKERLLDPSKVEEIIAQVGEERWRKIEEGVAKVETGFRELMESFRNLSQNP